MLKPPQECGTWWPLWHLRYDLDRCCPPRRSSHWFLEETVVPVGWCPIDDRDDPCVWVSGSTTPSTVMVHHWCFIKMNLYRSINKLWQGSFCASRHAYTLVKKCLSHSRLVCLCVGTTSHVPSTLSSQTKTSGNRMEMRQLFRKQKHLPRWQGQDQHIIQTNNTVDGRNPAPPGMYKTL